MLTKPFQSCVQALPTELYNIWRERSPPSLKQKTWRELVPADAYWSHLLVVTTDQKGNANFQTKVFTPLVISRNSLRVTKKEKYFQIIKFKIRNIFTLMLSQHGGKSYFTPLNDARINYKPWEIR